jgi:hypothetical protein
VEIFSLFAKIVEYNFRIPYCCNNICMHGTRIPYENTYGARHSVVAAVLQLHVVVDCTSTTVVVGLLLW